MSTVTRNGHPTMAEVPQAGPQGVAEDIDTMVRGGLTPAQAITALSRLARRHGGVSDAVIEAGAALYRAGTVSTEHSYRIWVDGEPWVDSEGYSYWPDGEARALAAHVESMGYTVERIEPV